MLKGKRTSSVMTAIKLKKEKSADGISYSSCVFAKAGDLAPAQIEALKPTVDWIKNVASTVPVVADADPQTADQTDADGFATVSDKGDLPF